MERQSTIKFSEDYQKLPSVQATESIKKKKIKWYLPFLGITILVLHSVISICFLRSEVQELQKKILLLQMKSEVNVQILKNIDGCSATATSNMYGKESAKLPVLEGFYNLKEKYNYKSSEKLNLESAGAPLKTQNSDKEKKKAGGLAGAKSLEKKLPLRMGFLEKISRKYPSFRVAKLQEIIYLELNERTEGSTESAPLLSSESENALENEKSLLNEEATDEEENSDEDIANFGFKRKREIRDYNQNSAEQTIKNETQNKTKTQKSSAETSSGEKYLELSSKEKFLPTSNIIFASTTRKPHLHRKHRKSRIGSAERFFTETHSTTSTPIQVRQSRTKLTQTQGIDKTMWLQNQKFQQHTSPLKDTITKEEALRKGYGKYLEDVSYDLESSRERDPDALSYNMITIHFSADTSHYSRERDPHYFGNGRMQIKSEVYKDWKPAHWTQGVGMSKYFHLHQGRVTVSTTGIYLIYAQIQYSNVQEVNGFSVFRNKEVVVQCITTSTHPDKHEIKSNTCGISTTILLQSNDSVCIKDLHHGRYVVLTPEKSYFGLVLLSPFKN